MAQMIWRFKMFEEYKSIIEKTLEEYFDERLKNPEYKLFKNVIESMKYTTCLGGKRLRGILCLETCKMFLGDFKAAIPAACALEMLHAQSLIHDDLPCMDNDDLRRGKPSNHKVYGEAIATLAGDALISFGPQIIIEKTPKSISAEKIVKLLYEYSLAAGAFGIVGGQTADIEAENSNEKISIEHLQFIHKYKTGALFKCSLLLGAIIGGANENELDIMRAFGDKFGLAFQIKDDILDFTSTTEIMGKTVGKDENSNKSTYVTIFGLESASEKLTNAIKNCDSFEIRLVIREQNALIKKVEFKIR